MPPNGMHALKLYVVCNSYVTADHDPSTDLIEVAKGEESQSDEDDE
jgi:pre-mRNA-splicing helicase BRR2